MKKLEAMRLDDFVTAFFKTNKTAAKAIGVCPTYLSHMKKRGDIVLFSGKNEISIYSLRQVISRDKSI